MQSGYKRGVGPRAKNGYQHFANEWNQEVADRCARMVDGEENVVLIRQKSAIQLQEHCDRLETKKRMAVLADSDADRSNRQDLRETMRETRQDVQLQAIPHGTRIRYPTEGNVPFGMPAPLNPTTLEGAVLHRPRDVMHVNASCGRPWELQPFCATTNVLVGYKKTTWCVSCGHRKADHVKEESFGYRCKREHYARCGWLKQHHQTSNCRMGPCCANPAKSDSPHSQWHAQNPQQRTGLI